VNWISCCLHADQILPKLPATHKRLGGPAAVLMGLPILVLRVAISLLHCSSFCAFTHPISYVFEHSRLLTGILHTTERLQLPLQMKRYDTETPSHLQSCCVQFRMEAPATELGVEIQLGSLWTSLGTWWRMVEALLYKPKVAGSISDGVTVILHLHNPYSRIMAPRSTQPLT